MQKFSKQTVSVATMDVVMAALRSRESGVSPGKDFVEELSLVNPDVMDAVGAMLVCVGRRRPEIVEDYSRGMEAGMLLMYSIYEAHIAEMRNPSVAE